MTNTVEANQLVKLKGEIKSFSGEYIYIQVQHKVMLFHQSEIEILNTLEISDLVLIEGIVKIKYGENIHIQVKNKVIVVNEKDIILNNNKKEKNKEVYLKRGA